MLISKRIHKKKLKQSVPFLKAKPNITLRQTEINLTMQNEAFLNYGMIKDFIKNHVILQ